MRDFILFPKALLGAYHGDNPGGRIYIERIKSHLNLLNKIIPAIRAEASGIKDPAKLMKRNDEAMRASSSLSWHSICILITNRRQLWF
jgi:hypothetical protein